MNFKNYIDNIQDFPKKGIIFRDIQPLIEDEQIFQKAIISMGKLVPKPDLWVGIESRGFIFASALAAKYGGGLSLIRKKGKLPNKGLKSISYELEYGFDCIEIKSSKKKKNVIVVDDVLATGGTMDAAEKLCSSANLSVLDKLVLIDLGFSAISKNVKSLIQYE